MVTISIKKQYVKSVLVSLICLILASISLAFHQWRQDWVLVHQIVPPPPKPPKETDTNAAMTALAQQHLFGLAMNKTGEVPLSNLGLRLTGTLKAMNGENSHFSKASISMTGLPSKIYRTGDKLTDSVKVYAIENDAVILENNGRLEKLPLPREKLQFKSKK